MLKPLLTDTFRPSPQNTYVRRQQSTVGAEEVDSLLQECHYYIALSEYDQLLLEESKTVRSPALSLCATSADRFLRTTELDG
jgi:hypothetical protein